jgi:hypothetical protein
MRDVSARKTSARDNGNFSIHQKPRYYRGFRAYREFDFVFAQSSKMAFDRHEQHRKTLALCLFYPGQKIFPQMHALGVARQCF